MSTTSLLRQSLMAQEKKEKQDSTTSMLRRSLEVNAGVAPGTFSPTNTAVSETPQRIYKPGAKAYAPTNLRSLAESTVAPTNSQEPETPAYVSPFAKNEDYAELSQYKSTKNGKDVDNRNFIDKAIDWIIGASDNENSKKYSLVNGYTTEDYDDELYEYINRNPDVVSRVNTNEATSGQYFSGVDQSFLQEMEDAEIADYNYLYATQGKDKANEFLQNLKKDLTKRQMDKYVAENQQYARENPVAASAWTVLSKPLEAVGLAGQLMDYKLDRDVDPNAGYNRFAKQNRTIRQTVPENWSKAGQFLYGTGMSILDNVYNMALVGAFGDIGGLGSVAEQVTLGLMSSSAASESVLESLEDGYSADRAIIQGALAGAIEYLTEKISWGALMEPNAWKDGTIKYILKNVRQEGLEEGISTVANWGVDLIGDIVTDENRSDLREVFTDYKDGNYKAMWGKLRDMGIDLALDVAGGALSGGVLAGGGSLVNLAANTVVGNNANADYSQSQIGNYVQESFNDTVGNNDASDYQQSLAKKAMNQFDQNGKVSNRTLGELMKSNAYMESERAASNNLLGEAMEQIDSGKTVSDSTVKEILDNKRAVDFLSRNSGLQLQDNMTRPERFQAVRNSLNQTIQQIDEVQAPARRVVSEIRQQNELYKQKTDMVSEFAKTLGEQGGRTLMHMAANEDLSNITSLAGAYTKVYNEVKANPEVNLNEVSDEIDNRFTPQQLNTIYKSAVKDYEADLKKTGLSYEGETNAEETATGSQDSGTDGVGTVSLDTEVSTGSVAGRTAEVESRRKATDVRIESIRNNAALNSIAEVTSAEAGIPGGVNTDQAKTVRVLSESQWSALDTDTYNFLHELKDMGYEVKAWTGTALAYDEMSGKNAAVRGFIQGNTIGVRVDANLSARKIAYHEMFHDMVKTDSSLQADMVKKINEHYGEGKLETIVRDYVNQYGWTKASSEEILNEILADAYAGIDIYEDLEMNYEGATQVSSDVRGFLSENEVKTRNGSNAGQFSRDTENKYLEAIKSGDTDTAQQIVDEAAKEAGYTIKAYHGTTENFNSFSRNKQGTNHDGYLEFGAGFYFTPNADEAREWVRRGRSGQSGKATAKVMSVYLNPGRIIGADDAIPEAVSSLQTMGLSKADASFISNRVYRLINYLLEEKGFSNTEVQETLKGFGYDAIDASYGSAIGKPSGQYVVFDPEQIKSADPVTYDDNGEPISLSDRFNAGKNDIRFSRDKWQIDGQMSLSDLEGYYQEKYDNVSEENIKTAAKETKGIIERIQNFQDKEVRNKSEKRVLGNIRTIALGITSEFIETGYIDFGGLKLSKNPSKAAAQIASYAMILRNPNFETFRILYTKGNQIVGNSAVTSYNVDTSYAALDKDMDTSNGMIRDQMKRLGADGYYLMHNHPSGSVNYSNADKQTTDYYRRTIAGFKGHIIIDHNQYGFFDASPDMKYSVNDIENGNAKDIHSRRINSPLLYRVINGPGSLADIAQDVVHNNDISTLIYAHNDGIRAIQEVNNKFLLSKDFKNYVNNRKLDFGSVQTFLVTNMKTFNEVDRSNLFSTGLFTDVVGDGETDELFGKSFYSLHEMGRGQWGTVKEAGLYRVYEEDNGALTQYSLDDKAPEDFTDKQKAAYEHNVNATFSDKLKTLGGSDIKRSKFGVGKEIGGKVYLHRDYANEVIPEDVFDAAKQVLAEEYPDFEYNCVEYGLKDGSVRFDEAPGFDTEREPIVGDYVTVNADGTTRKGHTDYIWHHKWLWVKDDYQGFDVQESWNWSRKWLSTISGKTYDVNGKAYTDRGIADGNGLTRWNAQMDAYGLPKDTYRFSVDSDETPVYQAHTSRGTSINTVKIPALYTKVNAKHGFRPGTTNIDIGAGVEGTPATKYLADLGVNSLPFDPFNRDRETNIKVLEFLQSGKKADTATCSNVLNVIDNADARANIVLEMAKSIKPDGTAYFTVYEDKKNLEAGKAGESKNKPDQWQEFRATKTYEDEIRRYFNSVETKNNVIIANEPKPNLPEAKWQITSTEYTDKQGNKPYDRDEVIRYSRDTSYMEAVNSGDMDTAQRMVDEAAKDAGYTIKAYHGTPNGTFNVFNDWSYFTENKDYADIYQNQGASSNRYKQTADNPRTYSVYLDPKEVFDTRNPRDREIFQNEFYMQWGNGTPLSERGLPDWTDGDDLIEFFEENGYDYNAFYLDEGGTGGYGEETNDRGISIIVKDSAQIKSADPVTYDDQGNVIPLSQRFNSQNNDIRYSRDTAPEFYSKLEREIEGYKGEKLGAASVTSYLKGKGVKDEEIKWTGIATFLEGKKSVSKAELLQYVRDNQIQIEEQDLTIEFDSNSYSDYEEARDSVQSEAVKILGEKGIKAKKSDIFVDYDADKGFVAYYGDSDEEIYTYDPEKLRTHWGQFKTPGGENYREILYKIPGSAYSNHAMKQHWDETGVLAHARVQDFETSDGRILFVDEIQSDWHNAGQSGTYIDGSTKELADKLLVHDVENRFFHDEEAKSFVDRINSSRGRSVSSQYNALYQQVSLYRDAVINNTEDGFEDFYKGLYNYELTNNDKALINKYINLFKEANENESLQREILKARNATPDAPFRNGTYIQYVLKDLLRKAAEGGYDYLAWTTGKMQEDRWSSEYAEGYRIEYDQDIPKFLSKYGKQWGAKLGEIDLFSDNPEVGRIEDYIDEFYELSREYDSEMTRENLLEGIGQFTSYDARDYCEYVGMSPADEERFIELGLKLRDAQAGRHISDVSPLMVPAIPITDAMKKSVLYEGQPRFSRDTTGMESELQKQNRELNKELKEVTERYHYFKDQLVLTKVRQATEQSANRVAKQLVKDYSSNVSADEIAKALREASKLVLNVKDDTDIDELQTQLKDALRPYAMQMVTNASELINAEDVETQKSIRNDLRNGTGIIVTEQMKKDVPDWASFRKAQFGNMKLVSGAKTNIHDVYLELSQKYGEGYFPADVANESDMLQVIADVMADLSAIYDNPYTYGGANIAEAIESCTNDMMMSAVGSLEAEQPTFADKKKAEKKEALRKQAIKLRAEALERVKEQRDRTWEKASAKYKKRIRSIYDKRQQYELRGKIRKKVKDLSGKLLRPTDDKHIPYALQGAVVDLLSAINTGSAFDLDYNDSATHVERGTGMATRKTTAWARLQRQLSDLRDQLILDGDLFDTDDQPGILTDLSGLTNTSIDSMDTETLQKVLTVLRNCETAIRSYNQMISESKWAEISEACEAISNENADKVGRSEYQPALEKTINLLTVDMDTPEAFFGRMGNAGKALFKMLRAAQDENIRILKEAQNFSQENGLYDLKLKDYEQKTVTVRFGNRDVEMSKAQLMELYILNKREAAGAHIDVGGILPEPVQKKWSLKKVTYSEPIRNVTQEDIAKAMSQLSPEDIKIAEAMQEFVSTVMTKHGNDAAMRVYGYKKFGEENYWPIRVNDQDLRTELGTVRTRARSVSKKGFTNAIKPNAKQSVVIGSIFDTFNEHVAEMANYASHLAVMEDMKRIYNFTEKNEDGAIEVSTKYTLRNVFGPKGTKYFEKLMQDLSNGTVSEQAYFGGLIGRFKAAAVGSNLRVILQQPTAIFRAMDMISPKYLAQGFLHVKSGREKALKNAPIAQWKDWGYFDINTGRSTKNILFENSSTLDRVQNVLMAGAGLADSISWGALYSAVEFETKDLRPDLDPRSKAFDDVVSERFSDIVDHSQVVDGVLQRSGIMRSENAIDKMATSFMAEPTKQFNMLASAIYNFRHAVGENKAQAGKVLARTTAAMVFAGVLNAAVQSIVDAIRNDDPEKDYWEKFLEKFTGEEDTLISFMSSNVGDFLNPAQYVPYAKDIVSIIQGYDVERMDVSLINDLYTDAKSMVNSFSGKGKYSTTNNIINFMNTASKFLGLSIGNVKRDVAGIANTIAQETGSYVFEYRMAKFTYNLNQATNKGRFVEILAKAYEAGDTEAFNIIMNDLIKEDKFATTTMTTEEWIKKRLKDKHQIVIK